MVHVANRIQSGISIYQSTWKKYIHICSQTLLNLISSISLIKCYLVDVCYRLSALKCGDGQFDPSVTILCVMISDFTTSIYWKYHFSLTPINIWTASFVPHSLEGHWVHAIIALKLSSSIINHVIDMFIEVVCVLLNLDGTRVHGPKNLYSPTEVKERVGLWA